MPRKRDVDEDRRVAIHEAGHAVAAVRLEKADGMHVSIKMIKDHPPRVQPSADNP